MITEFETTDFDEFAVSQSWDTRYSPTGKTGFEAKMSSCIVGAIQIEIEDYTSPIEISGSAPQSGACIVIPSGVASDYFSRGRKITHSQVEHYLPGQEVSAQLKSGTKLLAISIGEDLLSNHRDYPLIAALNCQSHTEFSWCPRERDLHNLRLRSMKIVEMCRKGIQIRPNNRYFTDEILLLLERVMVCQHKPVNRSYHKQFRLAREARRIMLERISDPPTILEVCSILHIPERTLHNVFSRIYGVPPASYLKSQRMLAARDVLMNANSGERVADVAMRFGFWELGYFARDYKAMFGVLPSETRLAGREHLADRSTPRRTIVQKLGKHR